MTFRALFRSAFISTYPSTPPRRSLFRPPPTYIEYSFCMAVMAMRRVYSKGAAANLTGCEKASTNINIGRRLLSFGSVVCLFHGLLCCPAFRIFFSMLRYFLSDTAPLCPTWQSAGTVLSSCPHLLLIYRAVRARFSICLVGFVSILVSPTCRTNRSECRR